MARYPPNTPYPPPQQYDIATPSPDELTLDNDMQARDYGWMPSELLASKYEETDMGDDEQEYNKYVRREITDYRPIQATFEYEEARGAVNARAGFLENRYYGARGKEDCWKPEIFLGFGGPGDKDPRGINTEADLKLLRAQEQARMRFVRFDPDMCEQITGGGRSQDQLMKDQQKLFKYNRQNMKTFERQMDGKRNGLNRVFTNKSDIPKTELVQSYGDVIRDYGLNPQRRANIICENIRNTTAYRLENSDQDFEIAKYSQACRKQNRKNSQIGVIPGKTDTELAESDNTALFRTSCLLISDFVKAKREQMTGGDADTVESQLAVARKAAAIRNDLDVILNTVRDAEFAASDMTTVGKNAGMVQGEHLARVVVVNHIDPLCFHNAEVIYKSVKATDDTSKIKKNIITDINALPEDSPVVKKTAKMQSVQNGKNVVEEADRDESTNTANYKTILGKVNGAKSTNGEVFKKESDNTQTRRPNSNLPQNVKRDNMQTEIRFNDNKCKERLARTLGSKYLFRQMDRDGQVVQDF